MTSALTVDSFPPPRRWGQTSSRTIASTDIPSGNESVVLPPLVASIVVEIERDLERAFGDAAGDAGCISSDTRRVARELAREFAFIDGELGSPNIGIVHNDEVVLEWWSGQRKVSIYVGEQRAEFIKVWGPDVDHDMVDGIVETTAALVGLHQWLRGR